MSNKRAFIAVTIRRLTEKQRPGELVSWPKIEFSAEKSGVFRGSQIWDCLDEEFRTESPMKLKRSSKIPLLLKPLLSKSIKKLLKLKKHLPPLLLRS